MDIVARYERNIELDGVEIYFNSDPGRNTKDKLLNNRWRYSGRKRCWYIYFTEENINFAKEICELYKKEPDIRTRCNYIYPCTIGYSKAEKAICEEKLRYAPIDRPLGQYIPISRNDVRYKRKRSFFS